MPLVPGGPGNDNLFGGIFDDTLDAQGGDDTLDGGNGGVDVLFGGSGNDLIFTRSDDQAFGGIGDDTISVSGDLPGVLDGGIGNDVLRFETSYDISGVTLTSIEQLNAFNNCSMTTSQLGSFALVSGYNSGTTTASLVLTQGGTATINLSSTLTSQFFVTGSQQAENLTFDPTFAHQIVVFAGGGADSITTGAGDDSLRGDNGADTLNGMDGNDSLDGGVGSDQLFGGNGNDILTGGTGDKFFGGAGDDLFSVVDNLPAIFNGSSGTDSLRFEGSFDISGALLASVDNVLLNGNDSMTAAQFDAFISITGYSPGTTTGTVFLTQGGTASVTLSASMTGGFTFFGSGDADLITFAPAYAAGIFVAAGFGDDVITSSSGADSLRGDDGNDILNGFDGNDTLDGGTGNDMLFGGNNDDIILIRIGDTANGGNGNDLLSLNDSMPGDLIGGLGQDTLRFESSYDITGSMLNGVEQANLTSNGFMTAAQLGTFLRVSGYNDATTSAGLTLTQGGTANVNLSATLAVGFSLQGSAQADILTFTPAYTHQITMFAGLGDDNITTANGSDSIRGDDGNDTLSGLAGDDTIDGGSGIDSILGGNGNDILIVRHGDMVFGGNDADLFSVTETLPAVLDGGLGNDTLRFENSYDITGATLTGFEQLNLNGNVMMTATQLGSFGTVAGYNPATTSATMTLTQGGTATVTLANTLALSFALTGSSQADLITFAPASIAAITVFAGNGNDMISSAAGADSLRGDGGNDTLLGQTGNDTLDGGIGIDSLDGGSGNDFLVVRTGDVLIGGTGDDLFSLAENAPASINGGQGTDTLRVEGLFDISDTILTSVEQLNLNGQVLMTATQLDAFTLVSGYNSSTSSGGVTLTAGGTAVIALSGTLSVAFFLNGSQQGDDVKINSNYLGSMQVFAGFGNDSITAGTGADILRGEGGNDTLIGNSGNDTLDGGSGADVLNGGNGIDVLTGGFGLDTFVFTSTTNSLVATPDRIVDFEGAGSTVGDTIDLSQIDADGILGTQDSFIFNSTGLAGISLIDQGTDTLVRINTDNDATFEMTFLINDGAVLASDYTAADFIL